MAEMKKAKGQAYTFGGTGKAVPFNLALVSLEGALLQQQQGGDDVGSVAEARRLQTGQLSFTVLSPAHKTRRTLHRRCCGAQSVCLTQPRFSAWLEKAGRPRSWSPEQGGEFLDAAFMAPTDV